MKNIAQVNRSYSNERFLRIEPTRGLTLTDSLLITLPVYLSTGTAVASWFRQPAARQIYIEVRCGMILRRRPLDVE